MSRFLETYQYRLVIRREYNMKRCKKCNTKYSDNKNFCKNCGVKLIGLMEKKEVPSPQKISSKVESNSGGNRKLVIGGIFGATAVILLFLFYFVNTSTEPYIHAEISPTGAITGISQNCRDVQEPYTVQVPYTYTYKYTVTEATYTPSFNFELGEYTKAYVTLANAENVGGQFIVNFNFRTLKGGTTTESVSGFVSAHSSKTFDQIFDNRLGEDVEFTYSVSPATDTRYKDEVRYRTVQICE